MTKKVTMLDVAERLDSWANPVSGFGTASKSKMQNVLHGGPLYIWREQAEDMYRTDWAARKCIDAPVFDMMRTGIEFMEDDGQEAAVELIEDELKRLKIRNKIKEAITEAWKTGGALIVFTFDDALDPSEPLNPNTVRGIKRIDVVQGGRQGFAQPTAWYYTDERLGQPELYQVTLNYQTIARTVLIHESRCIRVESPFTTSQLSRVRNAGWNDSRYQTIYEALRTYGVAVQSGEETLENFTFMILKMNDLSEKIKASVIVKRIGLLINRITSGRVALISNGEALEKIGTPITGLDTLMDRYAKYISAASWIPLSRFFSGEGGALNGNVMDGDVQNYYDWISELQESQVRPIYEQVFVFFSYYLKFDPLKIDFRFPSLWQQSEKERADTYLATAQADQIYLQNGVVDPMTVAESRFSGKEMDLTSMHVDFAELAAQIEAEKMEPEEAEKTIQSNEQESDK